jgi:hypothetical protein
MADRRIDGFFYGLFMDAGVLRERHVEPVDPRRAYVDHYALRIGRRATLVPTRGERSYGVVMALTHAELDRLYAAPGLEDYRPEAVVARCLDGGPVPALCYTESVGFPAGIRGFRLIASWALLFAPANVPSLRMSVRRTLSCCRA